MKKSVYSASVMLALCFVLSACDNDTDAIHTDMKEESVVEEVTRTAPQMIADDEYVKATIVDVIKDSEDAVYNVVFEVENRLNNDIDVGYTEILGNGQSLTSSISATRIPSGATGQATLYVEELSEGAFPASIELSLSISEYQTPSSLYGVKDYPLTIALPK